MSNARLAAKVAGKHERIQSPQEFPTHLAAQDAAATTLRSHASFFASFHPWFTTHYEQEPTLGAVTESVPRAWRDELKRRGKAVATIRRHHSCRRSYLVAAGRPVPFGEEPTEIPPGPHHDPGSLPACDR